jgi:hypothetical protein
MEGAVMIHRPSLLSGHGLGESTSPISEYRPIYGPLPTALNKLRLIGVFSMDDSAASLARGRRVGLR